MSFDALESSSYQSMPVSLYRFAIDDKAWCYNSSTDAIVLPTGSGGANETYAPCAISDTGGRQTGDINNDDLTITLPSSTKIPQLYAGTPPSSTVLVTVGRMNLGDPEAVIIWVGQVSSVKFVSSISAEIICRMLTSTFDRAGLRLAYGRGCPHALYDSSCRVDRSSFAFSLPVSAIVGLNVYSPGVATLAAGWLNGGMVEWTTDDGIVERRAIETQGANFFTILGLADGIEVGQYLIVYPGCDRTSLTCVTKFNNLVNYGGFPHLPGKSPFDGDPVF